MTNQQPLELSGQRKHQNSSLFSDYYLNERVAADFNTNFDLRNEAQAVYKSLRALREQVQPETLDEAQLESEWVQPVLGLLGHHFKVQVKIRYRESGHRRPDYLLLGTAEEVHSLTRDIYSPNEITHALAIGDAKKWGTRLDQAAVTHRNPSQQIDEYLRYSELPASS